MPKKEKQEKQTKCTIAQLRERGGIPEEVLIDLELKAVRLIQIQAEIKALEAEAGYTEKYSKVHHRGIKDEVEELCVGWDLEGFKVEDYTVYRMHGEAVWLDKVALLNAGVLPEQIAAGTMRESWSTVAVRQDRETGKGMRE